MKYVLLGIKLLILSYFTYLLYFLAVGYNPVSYPYNPPFPIFVIDMINLFIHEAGHFFFKIFGRWVYFLGGSLFQVLVPLALVIVTWKKNIRTISLPTFWLGESMINVSVYIQDAPYRKLHLLAKGLIHDWNWLLSDNLELAEPLGLTVYYLGLLLCIAGVVAGVVFAVISYQKYTDNIELVD